MATLLAAVGENGTVVLFDVESGAIRQRLEGHTGDVNDVAFHPEGAWLVTGGDDGQIIRWSLPTDDAPAEQLQAWEAPAAVWSVAVSPDGRLLATGGTDNDISLWKAETGELVRRLEGHEDAIAPSGGLAFSPSGQRLASASYDRTARVWDVETGESLQIFRGHSDVSLVSSLPVTTVTSRRFPAPAIDARCYGMSNPAARFACSPGTPTRSSASATLPVELSPMQPMPPAKRPGLSWSRGASIGRSGSGTRTRASL